MNIEEIGILRSRYCIALQVLDMGHFREIPVNF